MERKEKELLQVHTGHKWNARVSKLFLCNSKSHSFSIVQLESYINDENVLLIAEF